MFQSRKGPYSTIRISQHNNFLAVTRLFILLVGSLYKNGSRLIAILEVPLKSKGLSLSRRPLPPRRWVLWRSCTLGISHYDFLVASGSNHRLLLTPRLDFAKFADYIGLMLANPTRIKWGYRPLNSEVRVSGVAEWSHYQKWHGCHILTTFTKEKCTGGAHIILHQRDGISMLAAYWYWSSPVWPKLG